MVIHGAGYRGIDYRPTSVWARLWPIAVFELAALFRYRMLFEIRLGLVVFLACLGPSLANLGILLVQSGVWELGLDPSRLRTVPRMDPHTMDFYLVPVIGEIFSFVVFLILTSLVTCRSVAKDRETQALEIYWTRGISPGAYFFGKWLGSFLLVGSIFVAAPVLIWLIGVLLAPDWTMFENTIGFMPRVVLALTLFTAVLCWIAVGFSAIARTANAASMLWFVLFLGTSALGRVLSRVYRGEWWFKAVNPWDATKRVAEWICGYTPRQDYPPEIALLFLVVLVGIVSAWTVRRVRLVEAVG